MDVWKMAVDYWEFIDFKMQYFGREHMYASIVIALVFVFILSVE